MFWNNLSSQEDWRKRGIMTQCSVICLDIAIDHIPREDLKNRILTFSKVDRKIVLSHNQFEIFTLYRSRYALARQDGQRYRLTADGLKFSFKEHNSNVFIFFEDIAPNMRSSSSAPRTASSPTSSLEATSTISSNSVRRLLLLFFLLYHVNAYILLSRNYHCRININYLPHLQLCLLCPLRRMLIKYLLFPL